MSPTKASSPFKAPVTPASVGQKRKREALVNDEEEELPHGLGKSLNVNQSRANDEESGEEKPAAEKRLSHSQTTSISEAKVDSIISDAVAKVSPVKPKNYGHTFGKSPYPKWSHPTTEECQIVHDLLTEVHGLHASPGVIPAPSATFAGCGEVPSILDALVRTYLSSTTKGKNSGMAIQGILKTFQTLKEGTGKDSPDYNEIRLADTSVLAKAIHSGGLGAVKSRNVKALLDLVYEENQAHRDAYKKRQETGNTAEVDTEDGTITLEKSAELTCANPNVLTLDHMHALPDEEAFTKFLTYPGIGVKTAACVLLFCMKRPLFAVDTHVFRLCKWLGWVPETANRDKTFSHCEVMVPNNLKYGLHQLFIKHGQTCPRCRKGATKSSKGWNKGCVIDHLLKRIDDKKADKDLPEKKGKKGAKDKSATKAKKSTKGSPAKKTKKGKGKEKEIIDEEDVNSNDQDQEEMQAGEETEGPPAKKLKKGKAKEIIELEEKEEGSDYSNGDQEETDSEMEE